MRRGQASILLLMVLLTVSLLGLIGLGYLGARVLGDRVPGTADLRAAQGLPGIADTCYAETPYSASTGVFTVSGNSFVQTSTYSIPDADTQITSLTVEAWVKTNVTITTPSRSFTVAFSGGSPSTFSTTLSGFQPPWSATSGAAHRSTLWDVGDTGYSATGAGRVRVSGSGNLSTWSANPDHRIHVIVHLAGTTRSSTPCP